MGKRKPSVARVENVIKAYEREVYNPVKGWLAMMPRDPADEMMGGDLDAVHRWLRIFRDDLARGLIDWEAPDVPS